MQNHNKILNFAIIDPHIHQWDPYTTPHAAQHLVKYLGNYPRLMNKVMRLVKSKALLATLGTTAYALDAYLPQDYKTDTGHFHVESVVHIEANWHNQQRFAPVAEMIDLLQPLIHHAINMFGTERILFASNFPMDKASAQFVDIVTAYLHILEPYGDNALFQIFRHNAQQIYRIEI